MFLFVFSFYSFAFLCLCVRSWRAFVSLKYSNVNSVSSLRANVAINIVSMKKKKKERKKRKNIVTYEKTFLAKKMNLHEN